MKSIASLQIPLLALAPLLVPKAAFAADCAPCDGYFGQKQVVEKYCAERPESAADSTEIYTRGGTEQEPVNRERPLTCNEMKEKFRAEYGILGEQCEAWNASKEGSKKEKMTATVYTAAAATCWIGCYYPWAQTACTVVGGVATVTDLVQTFQLGSITNGLTAVLSGGGQAMLGFGTEYGTKAAMKAVDLVGGNKTPTDDMGEQTACANAILHTAIAGLKWIGMTGSEKTAKQSCSIAQSLRGPGAGTISGGSYQGTTGRGGTNGGMASSPQVEGPMTNESFMNEMSSAATADPFGSSLSKMPNADKIPEVLNKVGLTPDSISKGLDSQSPASMLSGMPGMPPKVAEALKNLDKEMANDPNFQAIVARSGGGASGGKKESGPTFPDLSALFGKKEEAGASLGATVDFKGGSKKDDNDIWHANWKGSIFQIVSGRLDKSRDKVDQLEWQSPLNRALTGLPTKPADKK